MAKHRPGSKWLLRKKDWGAWVMTYDDRALHIMAREPGGQRIGFVIDRRSARILAKRINECLDATTAKGKVR